VAKLWQTKGLEYSFIPPIVISPKFGGMEYVHKPMGISLTKTNGNKLNKRC